MKMFPSLYRTPAATLRSQQNGPKRARRSVFSDAFEMLECRHLLTAPVLNPNGNPTLDAVPEDVSSGGNTGTLVSTIISRMAPGGGISDVDGGAVQGIGIIGANQDNGTWQYSTNSGGTWSNFGATSSSSTLLLASNPSTRVRFTPNANYNGTSGITFVAWDQTAGTNGTKVSGLARGGSTALSIDKDNALITVTSVNDAPVLNAAGNPTLDAINEDSNGGAGTLISTLIARMSPGGGISDIDAGAIQGIAIIGANQDNGSWQFSTNSGSTWTNFGATGSANALFLASSNATRVRFVPNANFNGSSGLTFVAWDQTSGTNGTKASALVRGGTSALSVDKDNAYITVNAVNDAPVLNASGNPTLDAIAENVSLASNAGTLVSTILSRMSPGGGITDVDAGAVRGMAIIGSNQSNGTWQYSLNNGGAWTNFGATAPTNALLLASNSTTRIRFVPNANFDGTRGFTFVAWDQTTGANGGRGVTNPPGGTSAFSINTENVFVTVTNVNNAPLLNAGGNLQLNPLTGAGNQGTLVSDLVSRMAPDGGIIDPDTTDPKGIAILSTTQTNGKWQYSLNDGTTWVDVGTTGTTQALLLAADATTRVRYLANGVFTGFVRFDFVAWDQTTGTNGTKTNVTTRGGTTPYSINTDSAFLIINTAPVLDADGDPTLDSIPTNVSSSSNTGTLVSELIVSMSPEGGITDVDPGAKKGIAVTSASQLNGRWQYSTDDGSTWTEFGTGNINKWLLLASDDSTRVRFTPKTGFEGSVRLNFIAWDQTTGTNGTFVDAGPRGGSSAFSIATETAYITVGGGGGGGGGGGSEFDIVVQFTDDTLSAAAQAIFQAAADRWEEIIIGDIPDVTVDGFGLIDDLVIQASAPTIDGPGGVLGQAGPTNVRTGSFLPSTGVMEFDSADVADLIAAGQFDEVILHEMGHVLGIGTIWNDLGLLTGAGSEDPRFTGAGATLEYQSIFSVTETSVPVENTGGPGTADGHWRESIFDNELMTGFLNPGGANPLSRVTAASMADMGYVVNLNASDTYTDPTPLQGVQKLQKSVSLNAFTMLRPEYNVLGADAFVGGGILPLPSASITSGSGMLVWNLVSGAMDGIAITDVSSGLGRWQYSTNGGSSWTDVGSASTNGALTLAADAKTRVRFFSGSNFTGSEGISFVSWNASGTNGGRADATYRGNGTAFGANEIDAVISNGSVSDFTLASADLIDEVFSSI